MGVHTSLASLYAYAPIGERAFFEVPRNRGKNTTLLASLHEAGTWDLRWPWKGRQRSGFLRPTWSVCWSPALEPGQIVGDGQPRRPPPSRVRELIEARGCELLYLPAYSPDLNPIEEAFSKVKHILRKIGARDKEALMRRWAEH
jgi:hypothetical protein